MAISAGLPLIISELCAGPVWTMTLFSRTVGYAMSPPVFRLPYPAQIQGSLWRLHAMIHQLLGSREQPQIFSFPLAYSIHIKAGPTLSQCLRLTTNDDLFPLPVDSRCFGRLCKGDGDRPHQKSIFHQPPRLQFSR